MQRGNEDYDVIKSIYSLFLLAGDYLIDAVLKYRAYTDLQNKTYVSQTRDLVESRFLELVSSERLYLKYITVEQLSFLKTLHLEDDQLFSSLNNTFDRMSLYCLSLQRNSQLESIIQSLLMDKCGKLQQNINELQQYNRFLDQAIANVNKISLQRKQSARFYVDVEQKTPISFSFCSSFSKGDAVVSETIPFIPAGIYFDDLKGLGSKKKLLYENSQMQEIKKLNIAQGLTTKYQLVKLGLKNAKWDVIRIEDDLYAIYKARADEIEEKADIDSRIIEIAQNFSDLNFYSLGSVAESMLEASGSPIDEGIMRPVEVHYSVLGQIVRGEWLSGYLSRKKLTSPQRIEICILLTEALIDLHIHQKVHVNLRIEDYWYDEALHKLTAVDARAITKFKKGKFACDIRRLGVLFVEVLKLGAWREQEQSNQFGLSDDEANRMMGFIEKMVTSDDKPSLSNIVIFMNQFLMDFHQHHKVDFQVAYVNLNDFVNLTDVQLKKAILTSLKEKQIIYLVDVGHRCKDRYLELMADFQSWGICVYPRVIQPGRGGVPEMLDLHMQQLSKKKVGCVFEYVSDINLLGEVVVPSVGGCVNEDRVSSSFSLTPALSRN